MPENQQQQKPEDSKVSSSPTTDSAKTKKNSDELTEDELNKADGGFSWGAGNSTAIGVGSTG